MSDFQLHRDGNVCVLLPLNSLAQMWADETLPASTHRMGNGYAINERFANPIVSALLDDAYTVEAV